MIMKSLTLSHRLLACAGFVPPGSVVADVGCDHGYLGIYLLRQGLAQEVLACDIREGPLSAARRNAEKYGVADRIRFFLRDGLVGVPREYKALVCAGMGADTIESILEAAPWLRSQEYTLVLQCQSKCPQLRRYLSGSGFAIRRETLAQDGKFLYPVMEVVYAPAPPLTPAQCWLSPALLNSGSPLLGAYVGRILASLRRTAAGLTASGNERAEEIRTLLAEVSLQWEKKEASLQCNQTENSPGGQP